MNREAVEALVIELQADPRYAHLKVADEVRRCHLWGCGGHAPTQRKIMHWLNREAKKSLPKAP